MAYLVQIEDNANGNDLVRFLRSLNYVKVFEKKSAISEEHIALLDLYDLSGNQLDIEKFSSIIENAEQSNSIDINDAIAISKKWQLKRK